MQKNQARKHPLPKPSPAAARCRCQVMAAALPPPEGAGRPPLDSPTADTVLATPRAVSRRGKVPLPSNGGCVAATRGGGTSPSGLPHRRYGVGNTKSRLSPFQLRRPLQSVTVRYSPFPSGDKRVLSLARQALPPTTAVKPLPKSATSRFIAVLPGQFRWCLAAPFFYKTAQMRKIFHTGFIGNFF